MTRKEAIKQLQTEHDLIAGEHDLDGSQFAPALLEALAMAIEVLKCSEIPNCSEPKCADGCIYGWGSSECGHCDYRSEEPKTGDTISRKAAIDALLEEVRLIDGYYVENDEVIDKDDAIEAIRLLPSAQPERKIGKWTRPFPTRPKTYERFCSECKGKAWYCGTGDYNFCPNCGAKMEGE